MRKTFLLVALTATVFSALSVPISAEEKFDRAQNMVVNLNQVAGSTGFYLLKDIREVKEMDHDLGKALLQVQEVDKSYARLRGRKDERFLEAVAIKIQKAQNSRSLYEEDLKDAYSQLKSSIQDTMMTDQERKLGK
jgi:hypothetical protein